MVCEQSHLMLRSRPVTEVWCVTSTLYLAARWGGLQSSTILPACQAVFLLGSTTGSGATPEGSFSTVGRGRLERVMPYAAEEEAEVF